MSSSSTSLASHWCAPAGLSDELPLVLEHHFEVAHVPLGRIGLPGALEAARDRVGSRAGAVAALPAEPLLLDGCGFGFGTDERRVTRSMALAEGVAAGDERHGLLVVHGHACEGLANVTARRHRIRVAVRPLRVHVDEAHLYGCQRVLEFAVTGVTFVAEPLALRPPVDVLVGLPDVFTTTGETEGLESHRLEGDVAGENHQIGPRDLPAVLLLDRPEQPASLVQVGVVRPAVERREALLAGPGPAAAVARPVGARAVPCHPDHESAVVAVVGRPPVLRVGHERVEVPFDGRQVERLELLGVVELLAHRIAQGRVLVENLQVQLVRPPVAVGRAAAADR